jgi:hypothetical protein
MPHFVHWFGHLPDEMTYFVHRLSQAVDEMLQTRNEIIHFVQWLANFVHRLSEFLNEKKPIVQCLG